MEKPKYLIAQDGEPIKVSDYIPQELIMGENAAYHWIIRLKDLHYYWEGKWYPLQKTEQLKIF